MALKAKESHWYAFSRMKCPHCHHGDLFTEKNPYKFSKLSSMPVQCPDCGQPYEIEVGFYWGSMYVAYAITVLFSLLNILLLWALFGFHLYGILIANSIMLILLFPYFFRYSRVLWLQVNVPFSREAFDEAKKQRHEQGGPVAAAQ